MRSPTSQKINAALRHTQRIDVFENKRKEKTKHNNDNDTPTYLEAGSQHSVGIPRAIVATAAPLFCSSFAAGKQKK
jgi:hypothetical protein